MLHRIRAWAASLGATTSSLWVTGASLLLLAVLTAAVALLQQFANVGTVTIIYLIAVLFAAIRGGVIPAVISALAAIGFAAFFFYEPIYDFRVYDPIHLLDLMLFIIVAVVIGKLAGDLRKAKMREEADTLREALIGSVSHELRTPLSAIVGAASVLAQSPEIVRDSRLSPLVRGLRQEADRLNDHIQNLLDSTRISNEGVRPRVEWVDPGDIVNAAVARKQTLLAGCRPIVTVADDLPLVQIDPMLIERALGQLIENAIKYSPPESPIEISAMHYKGMIRIAVRDHGSGMSGDESERMWQRFYRSPRHQDIPGSGLGLWIARALVTACGGHLESFSAGIGHGTTVSIYLPVQPQADSRQIEAADD